MKRGINNQHEKEVQPYLFFFFFFFLVKKIQCYLRRHSGGIILPFCIVVRLIRDKLKKERG